MAGMSGMRIKVKPEQLIAISGEVEAQVKQMRQRMNAVNEIVNRSHSYWEGEGQTAYLQAYRSKVVDIEQALRNFSGHVTNLRTIAGVYETTEAEATEAVNTLSADVIV